MRNYILVLLLTLSSAAAAEAETANHFSANHLSLGAGISFHRYSDSRFKSREVDIVPMYRISRGHASANGWDWDLKTSIGFSRVDLPSDLSGAGTRIGKLRSIPLLLGVARAYRQGPLKIGAWVTAGPSFNHLAIDQGARAAYQAAGSNLEAVDAKTSFAFKPGVSASYRLSSLLALQSSVSYTINRPTVTTRIDGVSNSKTWKLDHHSARVGMVVGIF